MIDKKHREYFSILSVLRTDPSQKTNEFMLVCRSIYEGKQKCTLKRTKGHIIERN